MTALALEEFKSRQSGGGIQTDSLWSDFYNYIHADNASITGQAIRNHIRKIIEEEQNNQCCYCRRPLFNNAHAKPIEHILPHSKFVQHTFNILNLIIACVDCNAKKSDHVWSQHEATFRRFRHYPPARLFEDLFHPRFHRYDEHVKFIRVQSNYHCISIYTGLTEQGRNLCKNLLTHISKLEVFVSANSDLKTHIQTIYNHEAHDNSAAEAAIKEFQIAFQNATESILENI